METGRFQPPTEQERFGRAPDGAEGLSVSFVRAAYGATGVKQNPGDLAFMPFKTGIQFCILQERRCGSPSQRHL
ncbi:hypothetical protein [Desulfitobacterium sp. LBE]|uniref:hypothetical protein n=1 Tax=Desulfitobacterium sp. LBE TaxID=884086 RepID=UPI0011AA7CFB